MKIQYKILLFFLLIPVFGTQFLFAQVNQTIRAELNVRNIQLTNPTTLKFDIYLLRTTNDWERFANGTFQFKLFPDSIPLTSVTLDSTDLPPNTDIAGGVLPVDGYKQNFQIYPERLSITCLGPITFDKCIVVPKVDGILIGSYTVTSNQNIIDLVEWKTELSYYQACAYKIGQDSMFYNDPNQTRYYKDDNVPLINGNSEQNNISFSIDTSKRRYNYQSFSVAYKSDMINDFVFTINDDYKAIGYKIFRKYQIEPEVNPFDTDVADNQSVLVLTYDKTDFVHYDPRMLCQGWDKNLHTYSGLTDSVPYRGGTYCYQLWVSLDIGNGNVKDSLLGYGCAAVPALLIAQAGAGPNPFTRQTTISYELVEDAYITVSVWDVVGRKMDPTDIIDEVDGIRLDGNVIKTRGTHFFTFKPLKVASQGLFNIVIDAIPKNPTSQVEKGQAVLKVNLIKGLNGE
ncbi:MAG: hypothetical protein WCR42_14005 [bacterium]